MYVYKYKLITYFLYINYIIFISIHTRQHPTHLHELVRAVVRLPEGRLQVADPAVDQLRRAARRPKSVYFGGGSMVFVNSRAGGGGIQIFIIKNIYESIRRTPPYVPRREVVRLHHGRLEPAHLAVQRHCRLFPTHKKKGSSQATATIEIGSTTSQSTSTTTNPVSPQQPPHPYP